MKLVLKSVEKKSKRYFKSFTDPGQDCHDKFWPVFNEVVSAHESSRKKPLAFPKRKPGVGRPANLPGTWSLCCTI